MKLFVIGGAILMIEWSY